MAEVSLDIGNFQAMKIRLEATDVRGQNLAGQPVLRLPLKLQLLPAGPLQQTTSQYFLLRLAGTLSSNPVGELASFEVGPLAEQSNASPYDRVQDVVVPLDRVQVKHFEDARAGANAQLNISLSGLVYSAADPKFQRIAAGLLQVVVPKSHWVEEVVTRWGLSNVKIVEIVFPASKVGENFQSAYSHVESAEKLFANGLYKQTLVELYAGFEGLAKSMGFAKPDQQFFAGILAELHPTKKESAKLAFDSLCDFLHLGRHEAKEAPDSFFVSRSDARFALIMSQAVLEYISAKE
jgi:hypothetical protein